MLRSLNHTHAMVFAVADENGSACVHEDSVRPRQFAFQRIAIRAIAAFASARHQFAEAEPLGRV